MISESYIPVKFVKLIDTHGNILSLLASDVVSITASITDPTESIVTLGSDGSEWIVQEEVNKVTALVEEVLSGQFFTEPGESNDV